MLVGWVSVETTDLEPTSILAPIGSMPFVDTLIAGVAVQAAMMSVVALLSAAWAVGGQIVGRVVDPMGQGIGAVTVTNGRNGYSKKYTAR